MIKCMNTRFGAKLLICILIISRRRFNNHTTRMVVAFQKINFETSLTLSPYLMCRLKE